MSPEDRKPETDSRAVTRRAFMAAAAGLAAAWASQGVAGPRKRPHGDAHSKGRRKAAPPEGEIQKDKDSMQQSVDAVRRFELPRTAEPATAFIAGPARR